MAEMTNEELTGVLLSLMERVGALESGGVSPSPTPGPSGDTELPAEWTSLATTFVSYLTTNDIYSGVVGDNTITADNAWTFFMMGVNAALLNLDRDKLEAADITAPMIRSAVLEVLNNTTISTLMADYIKASDIVTGTLRTDTLLSTVAKFCQMISTTVSATDIQSFVIDSDHVHFQDACIQNAAIESIEASKITAGQIDTSKVTIADPDDYVAISEGLIQMCDDNYVRVQIGHIESSTEDTYDMRVWDEDGNMMWSASGITADAIKSAIIKDSMVAANANISASKLNIASVIQSINSMGGITTSSANITIDADNHKLSTWLQTMDSWKVGQADRLDTLETAVEVIDGQISSFVSLSQLTEVSNGLSLLQTDYSNFKQTYNSFTSEVNEAITETQEMIPDTSGISAAITVLQQQVAGLEEYDDTELQEKINALTTKVDGIDEYDDTAIRALIDQLRTDVDAMGAADIDALEDAIDALEAALGTLTTTVQTNNTTVTQTMNGITADITEINQSITTLQNTDVTIQQTVESFETSIDANAEAINILQSKQFVDETVLEQTYAEYVSQFEATAENIRLEMQEALSDGYVTTETFNRWFTVNTTGLTIGSDNSLVKLNLSNDGITFTQGDTEIGFWDGNLFHSRNLKVDVSYYAQFGNFRWIPKVDGSLVLQRV